MPGRGGLESVGLQAGQPQTGSVPGQVKTPAVRERFAVQILARNRVELSDWSRDPRILSSDWWNLTMLVPRSVP